jgi:hypothetical protein
MSDTDIWGLHTQLAPFIARCLTDYFSYDRHGIPGGAIPYHINVSIGAEGWNEVLKEMIFSFEFLLRKNDRRFLKKHFAINDYTAELEPEIRKRVQRGFDLFGVYYTALWD